MYINIYTLCVFLHTSLLYVEKHMWNYLARFKRPHRSLSKRPYVHGTKVVMHQDIWLCLQVLSTSPLGGPLPVSLCHYSPPWCQNPASWHYIRPPLLDLALYSKLIPFFSVLPNYIPIHSVPCSWIAFKKERIHQLILTKMSIVDFLLTC